MKISKLIIGCSLLGWGFNSLAANCQGNLNSNYSMDGARTGEGSIANNWRVLDFSPDLNIFSQKPAPGQYIWSGTSVDSQDGGTWQNILARESVATDLSGFAVGVEYEINFEYATTPIKNAIHSPKYEDLDELTLQIDGVTIGTSGISSKAWEWVDRTVSFTATSTDHTLSFHTIDRGGYTTKGSYMGLDSVSICPKATNIPPVADNDTYNIPKDDPITIDILGNDKDDDGDTLTITEIDGQAIAEGASITLSDGTVVTLTGGKLIVDPVDGSTAPINFSYTVGDGNGGTDQANVTLFMPSSGNIPTPVPTLSIYGLLLSIMLMIIFVAYRYKTIKNTRQCRH